MSWGKELENFVKCAPKRFAYFIEHGKPINWWSESACKSYHKKQVRKRQKKVRFKNVKRKRYNRYEIVFRFICFIN